MFDKVLIANRGEIARRVARTCRDMGLRAVAVYSDADADAAFVREADEAVRIGPAPSSESYLATEAILDAARRTGAGAIHPGYGFLSENADFAEACEAAGLVFVGPQSEAIRTMGSKIASKQLMAEHGIPVIPGFDGGDQSDAAFLSAAPGVGYPLLVKASAGGGGKGMRVVRDPEALPAALAAARREALGAFGDASLLIERYLDAPRHIEVQVIADGQGAVLHVFERECSVQRRHQKIIEETPSVAVDETLRAAMTAVAVQAARAIGYRSAGTVELILAQDGSFFFLEMNTRLQVEHPVTELVTGLDLVRLQLEIALGSPLGLRQGDITARGHAIEARLYAEDPARDFLPQTGRLLDWEWPPRPGLRLDSGVEPGDAVSIHYDPMLAKVIAWGRDREEARRRLVAALRDASVQGVTTNREFLIDALAHPAFVAGALSTGFVADHFGGWVPGVSRADTERAAIAATLSSSARRAAANDLMPHLPRRFRNNPFRDAEVGWRLNDDVLTVHYRAERDGTFKVRCAWSDDPASEAAFDVRFDADGGAACRLTVDGHRWPCRVAFDGDVAYVHVGGASLKLARVPRFPASDSADARGGCKAPMPGKVLRVLVAAGDEVAAGAALVIVEAMKMEHTVSAPSAGVVEVVLVEPDEVVEADQELVRLTPVAKAVYPTDP